MPTTEQERRIMTSEDLEIRSLQPGSPGVSAQRLVTLGQDLAALGIVESRAVIAELQEIATEVAVKSADVFLGRLRNVVMAKDALLMRQVLALPILRLPAILIGQTPYVSRDSVIALIQASGTVGARQ
jgi:hypothetical protein